MCPATRRRAVACASTTARPARRWLRPARAAIRIPTLLHGRTAAMGDWSDDLTLALTLADDADALTVPRFGAVDLHVDTKPDLTPVTDADRSVEQALREVLSSQRPRDGVVGEEFGGSTEFA